MTTTAPVESARQRPRRRGISHQPPSMKVLLLKIALLCVLDAAAVFAFTLLFMQERWVVLVIAVAATVAVNVIYLNPGMLPAKYLAPGLVFLAVFQIFVVLYSCYIAFTNYGDGHNSTKEDAVSQIIAQNTVRVEGSAAYEATVVQSLTGLGLLVTDSDGQIQVGGAEQPLADVDASAATIEGGRAVAVEGWTALTQSEILAAQSDIAALQVPISDDPNDGFLNTRDALSAYVFQSTFVYDEAAGTMTDSASGTVYEDLGNGQFETAAGEHIDPGWQIIVGLDNFAYPFTHPKFGEALVGVTIWTFAFSIISVGLCFILGLFLAITFNDPRLRGRKVYRVLMILPYAFPSFLSALVWLGLLNTQFGFINQVVLGGLQIPWLTDPWLAKLAVIIVNVWLGFPYMFLVCTGALQSIPEELTEAATVDGARPFQVFRLITFPLLLVSVAPLLISSFAFNFNNFNIIYMLTGGGPRIAGVSENVGSTDLLITLVYKTAFESGSGRDYGLASALAIIIFIIVAVISAISFRQTKALEELN